MAIEKQQPMAALYGRAAQITGESQRAMREAEEARRAAEQMRTLQIQHAREERSQQRQLEAEERSHQWEMEKMEMRSRVDFAEQESRRQEKRANLQAAVKKIDELAEAGQITSENAEAYKTKAIMNYHRVSLSDRALGLVPETRKKENPMMAALEAKMGEGAVPTKAELEALNTEEAFNMAKKLGYPMEE